MTAGFLQRKLCDILFILLSIWYNEKRFIWHFLEAQLKLNFSVKTSAHLLHYYTKRGENFGKMTSCKPSKDNLFLFLFHKINVYFVRERFELSIGIYVSTENTFFMKLASSKKMVKTWKLSRKKQNKKNWRQ